MSNLNIVEAKLPPGFRFHPSDEELISDYLMKKLTWCEQPPLMIEVDLNNCEPWDIPVVSDASGAGRERIRSSNRDIYSSSNNSTHMREPGSVKFTLAEIYQATRNFSPSFKIGQGGFGTVYKGRLEDGTIVAVKRAKKVGDHLLPLLNTYLQRKEGFKVKIAHRFSPRNNANLDTYCQKREVVNKAIDILSEMKDGFECEEELNDYGYTPIHVAASNGYLETLRTLIVRNANECLRRDKHGGTPLHAGARRGRVEALKVILEACPETVKMVTVPGENCLHTAVLYNQVGAVRFLVEWLEKNRDYAHLINGKDYDGKTTLHLATSREQIKTLEVLLSCNTVDVNAMCSGSFTALDILDVLPCTWKIGVEINRILGQAGAMRARDLANRDANSYAAEDNKRKWFKTIDMSTIIPFIKIGLLLMATLVTTITYEAAFTAAGATLNEGGGALCFFMWFNLLAFFGSLAVGMIVISKYSLLAA